MFVYISGLVLSSAFSIAFINLVFFETCLHAYRFVHCSALSGCCEHFSLHIFTLFLAVHFLDCLTTFHFHLPLLFLVELSNQVISIIILHSFASHLVQAMHTSHLGWTLGYQSTFFYLSFDLLIFPSTHSFSSLCIFTFDSSSLGFSLRFSIFDSTLDFIVFCIFEFQFFL